jgi:hypothetical protein
MPKPKETPAGKSSNKGAMTNASRMAVKAQAGKQIVKINRGSDIKKRKKAEASTEASENDELDGSEVSSEASAEIEACVSQIKKKRMKKASTPSAEVSLSNCNFCSFTCNDYVCPLTGGYN